MAPEVIRGGDGQHYSGPSDVYSFGILLLEMIAGKQPYEERSLAQFIGIVGYYDKHRVDIPDKASKNMR